MKPDEKVQIVAGCSFMFMPYVSPTSGLSDITEMVFLKKADWCSWKLYEERDCCVNWAVN